VGSHHGAVDGNGACAEDFRPTQEEILQWMDGKISAAAGVEPRSLDPRALFTSYGLDSISGFTLNAELADWLGRELSATLFWEYPTLEKLARHLGAPAADAGTDAVADAVIAPVKDPSNGRSGDEPQAMTVTLQPDGKKPPLFCICGIELYRQLAVHMGPDQPVYGVLVPSEITLLRQIALRERTIDLPVVETLAASYLEEIRKMQPVGPYCLAGVSFGGVLAFEIAQQLRKRGDDVAFLALFDALLPSGCKLQPLRRFVHAVKQAFRLGPSVAMEKFRRKIEGAPDADEMKEARGDAYRRAMKQYVPQSYPGKTVLFRARDRSNRFGYALDPGYGWQPLIESLETCDVPGSHIGLLSEPHVTVLAERTLALLQDLHVETQGTDR